MLNVAERYQSSDSHWRYEKPQSKSCDDKRLGFGCHVEVPDQVNGHAGNDEICQDAHDACSDPACENGCDIPFTVEPRLFCMRPHCHADE